VGDDLREGKPTLPLIHAMQHAAPQVQTQIRDAIANGGTQDVNAIMASIEQTGSLDYTRNKAQALAESAKTRLGSLASNPYTESLAMLCD
ncbi:polyprenyl synthetase family protein, partial [Salmonella enterica subsp. enterica]